MGQLSATVPMSFVERHGCGPRTRIALSLGPLGRLAHELAKLGEKRRSSRAFAPERLDSFQPRQDRSRFLHASKVGGES
jgi:hypothetical protein